MFRLIISVVFLVASIFAGVAFHLMVDDQKDPVAGALRQNVMQSHKGYQTLSRLRGLQMEHIANDIASSDIMAYLSVLDSNRSLLYELEVLVNQAYPAPAAQVQEDEKLQKTRRAFVDDGVECVLNTGTPAAPRETQCSDFVDDLTADITTRVGLVRGHDAWRIQSEDDFKTDLRASLLDCSKIYALSSCFYSLTWPTLQRKVNDIRATPDRYGINPDLVVLTDRRGAGLANPDKPNWSEIVAKDKLFADGHPVIRRTKDAGTVHDVLQLHGSGDHYFVTATPILDGKTYRGAIMVGVAIDEILLAEEAQVLGFQVSYLDGQKLISSSLSDDLRSELLFNLPPRRENPEVHFATTDQLDANFVPIVGNTFNHDIQVVLSANRAKALKPFSRISSLVPLWVAMCCIIGIICFVAIFRNSIKPLVEIDSGIHEIMNGNHEYEFPSHYSDKLWASMAQSLNRMVGILLGRELEDDELEAYLGVVTRETQAVEVPEGFLEGDDTVSDDGDDDDEAASA